MVLLVFSPQESEVDNIDINIYIYNPTENKWAKHTYPTDLTEVNYSNPLAFLSHQVDAKQKVAAY